MPSRNGSPFVGRKPNKTRQVEEKGGWSEAMIKTVINSISEKVAKTMVHQVAEQVAKKMIAKLNPRIDEILDGIRESDNNKNDRRNCGEACFEQDNQHC